MKVSSYGNTHSQQQADASAGDPSSPDTQGEQAGMQALHCKAIVL